MILWLHHRVLKNMLEIKFRQLLSFHKDKEILKYLSIYQIEYMR